MMAHPNFAVIRDAYRRQIHVEVTIHGRVIGYEPTLPPRISAYMDTDRRGWTFGPHAFSSPRKTRLTVLQELHRHTFSDRPALRGAHGAMATTETRAADAFANAAESALGALGASAP